MDNAECNLKLLRCNPRVVRLAHPQQPTIVRHNRGSFAGQPPSSRQAQQASNDVGLLEMQIAIGKRWDWFDDFCHYR